MQASRLQRGRGAVRCRMKERRKKDACTRVIAILLWPILPSSNTFSATIFSSLSIYRIPNNHAPPQRVSSTIYLIFPSFFSPHLSKHLNRGLCLLRLRIIKIQFGTGVRAADALAFRVRRKKLDSSFVDSHRRLWNVVPQAREEAGIATRQRLEFPDRVQSRRKARACRVMSITGLLLLARRRPSLFVFIFTLPAATSSSSSPSLVEANTCLTTDGIPGRCELLDDCPVVYRDLVAGRRLASICGYTDKAEAIVCCPIDSNATDATVAAATTTTTTSISIVERVGRVAERKCSEYASWVYALLDPPTLSIHRASGPVNVSLCAIKTKKLIVGGTRADPREFPHMAAVGFARSEGDGDVAWLCGGTLVSERFVLTAAHCTFSLQYGPARWIRVGDLNLAREDDDARPQTRRVLRRIRHPDYARPAEYHDIALLELETRLIFDAYVRPACLPLPSPPSDSEEGAWRRQGLRQQQQRVVATGWGRVSWGESFLFRSFPLASSLTISFFFFLFFLQTTRMLRIICSKLLSIRFLRRAVTRVISVTLGASISSFRAAFSSSGKFAPVGRAETLVKAIAVDRSSSLIHVTSACTTSWVSRVLADCAVAVYRASTHGSSSTCLGSKTPYGRGSIVIQTAAAAAAAAAAPPPSPSRNSEGASDFLPPSTTTTSCQ